ncbi:MAG: hypothetical protein AAF559_03640 [Pseudomonadota bacterium]
MRKSTFMTASVTALALGGASVALANHASNHSTNHFGGHRGGPGFEQADTDGDGVITLDEAKAKSAERFAKMDANADGSLSREDREARAANRLAGSDTDQDGEISPQEMTAAREKREAERAERRAEMQTTLFERLDSDGSGGLSQAELEAGKAMRAQMGGEGRRRGKGPRMGRTRPTKMAMMALRRADTNYDNAVSREEFDAMIEARFARIDTDGSGAITEAEREAAKSQMRARLRNRTGQGASS